MHKISRVIFNRCSPLLPAPLREKCQKRVFLKNLRNTDIFLIGHPKSGNTWLAYAVALLLNREQAASIHLSNLKQFVPTVHGRDYAIADFGALRNPRVFRNERPLYPDDYPKVIYLVRDPRAVLVSYYHHYCAVNQKKNIALDDFIREYLRHGRIPDFEPDLIEWGVQVSEWVTRSRRGNILLITYEEMKRDMRTVLKKVAAFLGITADDAYMGTVVSRSDFASMKRDETAYGSESYAGASGPHESFVRKGEIEGWKSELSEASAALIRQKYTDAMQHFGYT